MTLDLPEVPWGLEARLTFHYPQIVRLLLESVE
jgi:hypothetical protein